MIRRLRRPPRGHSCLGAFRGLSIPVHRLSRCLVSGVLAGSVGGFRSPGLHLSSPGTLRPVSRPSSGSLQERRLPLGPVPAPCCHVAGRCSASVRRLPPPDAFRPRGFYHLDGLLRSWPPACFSWHQIWGSPGWSLGVRWCSYDLAIVRPPRTARGMTLCAPPCEGFLLVGSRSTSLRPAPLLPFIAYSLRSREEAPLRSARTEVHGRRVPLRLRRQQRFGCCQRMGQRIALWDVSVASLRPVARALEVADTRCGSNPLDRRALAGLLESNVWTPSPVPLAGTGRRSNHFEPASGDGALLLPLPPRGGRVAGVSAALRSLGAPLDLRSLGVFLAVHARGTEYSVFDGAPGRRGSSRSLAAPVAPSPSVTAALQLSPADFRVLLHRRVQSNPGVCCNFRVLCSFLGFVSPPRLSPGIA